MPHNKPYIVHKNDLKHFQDLFQFPWNDAITFLRFRSSVDWWKPTASPCIVQCHQTPSHFESLQSFITLSVCPFIIFFFFLLSLSSQSFVLIFLGLHEKQVILSRFIHCILFLYSCKLLPSWPQSVFFFFFYPYCVWTLSLLLQYPQFIFHHLPSFFLLSHTTDAHLIFVPSALFLCFSLAVWICPSPNRLSHLNDGCLRFNWQPRSDSFSLCHGVK